MIRIVECIHIPRENSLWLYGVVTGWIVGDEYFVGAICLGGGKQLDLDDEYDGSPERIQAMQYANPGRKFPVDECVNPWQIVRLRDDKSIERYATLNEAIAWAKGAVLWERVRAINLLS
jgi:hypothetical protein